MKARDSWPDCATLWRPGSCIEYLHSCWLLEGLIPKLKIKPEFSVEALRILAHDGSVGEQLLPDIETKRLRQFYVDMLRARRFDERMLIRQIPATVVHRHTRLVQGVVSAPPAAFWFS